MIAGKTRDKLQPWEPKQDKKCLNFQVFPWGKNNNDEKEKKKTNLRFILTNYYTWTKVMHMLHSMPRAYSC
jgi:hypothetical protein